MAKIEELTQREQEKLAVVTDALSGKITKAQAAIMLGISTRQVKRLKSMVREHGAIAVIHKLKGKQSNHHIEKDIKEKALTVIAATYRDFKPSFATEKLAENHAIQISYGTTRLWMIEKGLWKSREQKKVTYRSWRPRKDYYGELQQFDGSYHYWFEDRFVDDSDNPIEVCLLAAIDDATGQITKACFAANEGVVAVFTFWKEYALEIGKPISIYLDRFSTYKINHKAAVDNSELMTQFERVMKELGISIIFANSPQAKGRVERLFQTLQDRLVKEMRLANIVHPTEGSKFLQEIFIPIYNSKFAVPAVKEGDVHKPLLQEEKVTCSHIFSIKENRKVHQDFTIQFKNKWYQLTEIQPTTVRPLEVVGIEVWLDNSVHIMLKHYELTYFLLPEKPQKQKLHPIILTTHKLNYKPPPNHPWRQYAKLNI